MYTIPFEVATPLGVFRDCIVVDVMPSDFEIQTEINRRVANWLSVHQDSDIVVLEEPNG